MSYPEDDTPIESLAKVEIADPDLCFRYTATLIHDIEIAESPQWMQDALTKAGLRPINNIVDITNYVMLEYGQPLHAFDFGKVKDSTIIVRAARPDEKLETLDGATRALRPPMLCIADTQDAIGLAGVMGGANTEIDESTTAVLLESANFHAINTRRTRLALRMDSEASYRFERGIRPELAPRALRRATQLMIQLAGGRVSKGMLDIYPEPIPMPSVQISRQRIRQVLGRGLHDGARAADAGIAGVRAGPRAGEHHAHDGRIHGRQRAGIGQRDMDEAALLALGHHHRGRHRGGAGAHHRLREHTLRR